MSGMTYYMGSKLLDHVINHVSYASPLDVWIGLFTSPTDAYGSGTEVSGGGYLRRQFTATSPNNGMVFNDADIFFPTATLPWGTITHLGIFDSSAGGNMLFFGNFTTPRYVNTGNVYHINKNAVSLRLR